LELSEFLEDFRFVFGKVDPYELAEIINETNTTIISSNRITSRTPNIKKDELQGSSGDT
jgi:hypothetical protein